MKKILIIIFTLFTFKAFAVDAQTQKMFDIVCGTASIRKALTTDPNFEKIKSFIIEINELNILFKK